MFKQNKLSTAIFAALAATGSNYATAQDAPAVEEVIVTGIRASVEAAMDIKRDSAGVVDAINAEDIGKFPDSNLAESLQRISGVSIDRKNGEGYQVTVRGFGPEFNLVTLNGRSMPTAQLNTTNGGPRASRTFDMSNIASEGVSGVEVYKTSKASISSGGIGATVNLKTRRPMDTEGLKYSVGVKMVNDTTVRVGDEYTPEYTGFFSWSNDMFGASVSYSEQDRESGNSGVFMNGWADYSGPWTDATFFEGVTDDNVDTVRLVNEPAAGQQTNSTPGLRYHHQDFVRNRQNSQVTLQFAPMENLTATLDYTRAEQETEINSAELSFWFGGGSFPVTDVMFDGNAEVATPKYLWTENPSGAVRDIGLTQNAGHYQNTLESTGLNIEFFATDSLSVTFDAHNTTSEALPGDGSIANYINIATGAQGMWAQGFDNSGDLPLLVGVWEDDHQDGSGSGGIIDGELDIADVGSTVRQIYNDRSTSEITQAKLDVSWEFDDDIKIDFGLESSSMEATQRRSELQETLEGNWGVGTPGDVPVLMMEELDFAKLFDGYSTELSPEARGFFDTSGYEVPDTDADGDGEPDEIISGAQAEVLLHGYIAEDVAELGELLSYNAGREWAANPNDNLNRTIKEDTTAFYVQGSYTLDVADMPLSILAGVRHETTDVESIGQVAPSAINWQGDNDFSRITGNAYDAPIVRGEGSYSITLPSIDLSLGITDDVLARFSYSTSIARASYDQLLKGINSVNPPEGGPTILGARAGTARDGNPNLKPLESNNIDLSFEWYFGDASYASVGYFIKDVPNFVGTATRTETISDVLDPTNGPRAEAAVAQLESLGIDVNQQTLFAMVAAQDDGNGGCVNQLSDDEQAAVDAGTYTGVVCGSAFDAGNGYDFGDSDDYAEWVNNIYQSTDGWEDNVDLRAVDGDPNSVNRVNYPVDSQEAKLDGFEFAVQHFFGDTGFGVQANYTLVDGDIEFDITSDPADSTQFALTGLSDSANLILMYENYDISARLTYNWRDEFLVSTNIGSNEPEHTEAYSQVDFNIGYQITDEFSVSFEGINVTEEDSRTFGRTESQLRRISILGARYAISARYTF